MQKFQRWFFEHKKLAVWLFSIYLCVASTVVCVAENASVVLIVVINAWLILATLCYADYCAAKLLQRTYRTLREECDPEPFLQHVEKMISRTKSEARKQLLTVDLAVALVYMGDYRKVYDILKSINIDKFASTLPLQKVCYYNNLADVCMKLEDFEEAELWYQKTAQLYADVKSSKLKASLAGTIQSGEITSLYCKKDYEGALELLNSRKPECLLIEVEDALLCARIYVAQGETALAKQKLEYVIANGNKTCLVGEAQDLLKILET